MRFIFFFFFLISCSNDSNLVQTFFEDEMLPVEEMKEVKLLQTDNGNKKIELFANRIYRYQERDIEILLQDSIVVVFYNDSLQIESILKADNATIDKNNIMIVSDNVVLQDNINKKLETEELIWDEKKNKIYTDKRVKITTNNEIIFGEGFVSDPSFNEYSISNIQGTFDVKY